MSMPVVPEMMLMELRKMDEAEDLSGSTMKDFFKIITCITVMWSGEQKTWLDRSVERVI
mgnify:FL=1